jgi:methylated-DNA-protein-cysteine methyltransferase-like protein
VKFFEQVYALVAHIPPGRVATYGQIARLLGQPHAARTVGWAMKGVSEEQDVPWQRVINASGRISLRDPEAVAEQRRLLEAEGVVFSPDERVDLDRFVWDGLPEGRVRDLLQQWESNNEAT